MKKNGKIDRIELVEDIGGRCGQEAVRIINLMVEEIPYWIPPVGARRRVIEVKYIVPIRFELKHRNY